MNSTDRHPLASGLAQFGMSIRLSRRRGIDRTGRVSAVPLEAVSVGGLFCFDTSIRTDRRMVVNFATRKEHRWRFRVPLRLGRRSCVPRSEQYRRYAQECLLLARHAQDEQARASLLHMAQVWCRLAEERASEVDERQSAEG